LSRQPGFTIREVWYLSVATVALQAIVNLLLLRREFVRKLNFGAQPTYSQAAGVSAN
jgi:hypothetical protein